MVAHTSMVWGVRICMWMRRCCWCWPVLASDPCRTAPSPVPARLRLRPADVIALGMPMCSSTAVERYVHLLKDNTLLFQTLHQGKRPPSL